MLCCVSWATLQFALAVCLRTVLSYYCPLLSVLCSLFSFCSVFLPHPLNPSPMSLLSLHHLFFIAYIDLRKNMYSLNQYRSLTSLVFRLTPEFVYTFFFYSSVPPSILLSLSEWSPRTNSTRLGSAQCGSANQLQSSVIQYPVFLPSPSQSNIKLFLSTIYSDFIYYQITLYLSFYLWFMIITPLSTLLILPIPSNHIVITPSRS